MNSTIRIKAKEYPVLRKLNRGRKEGVFETCSNQAIKIVEKSKDNEYEQVKNELKMIEYLTTFQCEYVVKYYEWTETIALDEFYIVMEKYVMFFS
jgi:hypothetical protein